MLLTRHLIKGFWPIFTIENFVRHRKKYIRFPGELKTDSGPLLEPVPDYLEFTLGVQQM
jgi:hypothetical protein